MKTRTVYFDTETEGLNPAKNVIIQIAAVAVDEDYQELASFGRLLRFDASKAEPEALEINSYDPERWAREAIDPHQAFAEFDRFLRDFADVEMVSKKGNPFKVVQLAGHNIATFDMPFLQAGFKEFKMFLPASFLGLDTLQLALWWRSFKRPTIENLKLGTLAKHFGIPLEGAHDAMADVRANVQIARMLREDLESGF